MAVTRKCCMLSLLGPSRYVTVLDDTAVWWNYTAVSQYFAWRQKYVDLTQCSMFAEEDTVLIFTRQHVTGTAREEAKSSWDESTILLVVGISSVSSVPSTPEYLEYRLSKIPSIPKYMDYRFHCRKCGVVQSTYSTNRRKRWVSRVP